VKNGEVVKRKLEKKYLRYVVKKGKKLKKKQLKKARKSRKVQG
jgi:hypothetical protein